MKITFILMIILKKVINKKISNHYTTVERDGNDYKFSSVINMESILMKEEILLLY
ncbi:MAG: hypothetical protein PV340_02195 [Wolbachia sp.]|nr:hypothetical protein [Wolbachia sp.]MDD9335958.1 hypothetical protein [Wolbachia sp.]